MTITERFIELAVRMIDRNIPEPNAVWVSIANDVVADTDEPWKVTRGASVTHDVRILFYQDTREDRQQIKYDKDSERNSGLINGIMYQTDFEPLLKDIVRWQGRELVVKAIDPVQPIDNVIVYEIEFGL